MKRFLKLLGLFGLFSSVLTFIIIAGFFYKHDVDLNNLPALNFSDSYSFNEKIRFMKENKTNSKILGLGSSMTLNNLDSETITKHFDSDSYLNAGSWGMSPVDDYKFLQSISDYRSFEKIIICTNFCDFTEQVKNIDFDFMNNYLNSNYFGLTFDFISKFDLEYYTTNIPYSKKVRSTFNEYTNLQFEEYGSVPYEKKGFKIDSARWNNNHFNKTEARSHYVYLDSIAWYCNINDIELVVLQSPYRNGVKSKLDYSETERLDQHIDRVQRIVENRSQTFVNMTNYNWDDSLFVDGIHFSSEGSKIFTEKALKETNP